MPNIPLNRISDPVYNCSELLNQTEQDLGYAENVSEFLAMQARQSALLTLTNCGVEFTTLAQLNEIAKTDT